MPKVGVAGAELYYERAGAGEPLLLIQGMSATHLSWGRAFAAPLEKGFEVISFDTNARLGEISALTLVLHGDADRLLAVENGRQIASLLPAARLRILEGVGHMFWWEQAERSAGLVRDHILAG